MNVTVKKCVMEGVTRERALAGQDKARPEHAGMLPRSDELLARLVTSGGERPFRALFERYHAQLYRYCDSILRNEADAQDALQSTFTRALVALREDRRTAPLRPWLYRIAHNESVSVLRARRSVVPEPECESLAAGPSAEERADERARLELLLADLAQLAERGRAALVMRELGGLSHGEIAAALEIPVGAAKQAIFEARSALLQLAEGRAMACDEVMRRLSDGDRRVLRGRQVRAHLRDCASCSAFAAAIPARQTELGALFPALPPAAAAAVLSRVLDGAAAHGARAAVGASATSSGSAIAGSSGGASAGVNSTAISSAKVVAAIVTPKALLATAVVAGAAAGAGGLVTGSSHRHAARTGRPDAGAVVRAAKQARMGNAASTRNSPARSHKGSAASDTHGGQNHPASVPTKANGARGQNLNSTHARSARGNSANAPGHSTTAPGNSGHPPGQARTPPWQARTPPGHAPTSRTGIPPARARHRQNAPGLARHDHTPPGQSKPHGNPHKR